MTSAHGDKIALRNSLKTALLQRAADRQAMLRAREEPGGVHRFDHHSFNDISAQEQNLAKMLIRAGGDPNDLTFEELS